MFSRSHFISSHVFSLLKIKVFYVAIWETCYQSKCILCFLSYGKIIGVPTFAGHRKEMTFEMFSYRHGV